MCIDLCPDLPDDQINYFVIYYNWGIPETTPDGGISRSKSVCHRIKRGADGSFRWRWLKKSNFRIPGLPPPRGRAKTMPTLGCHKGSGLEPFPKGSATDPETVLYVTSDEHGRVIKACQDPKCYEPVPFEEIGDKNDLQEFSLGGGGH